MNKIWLILALMWLFIAIVSTHTMITEPSRTIIGLPYIVVVVLDWSLVGIYLTLAFWKENKNGNW